MPFDAQETDGVEAPTHDCPLCPRLVGYREQNRQAHPDWFNGPVPSWGPFASQLLIVGMAPGVKGANRTGRPFTGDHAGVLLYETLLGAGLARGRYDAAIDDGLELTGCRIINAVRCVPPANLPMPPEAPTCNRSPAAELQAMPNPPAGLCLGVLSHAAVLKACGIPPSRIRFRHGQLHQLPDGLILADSYHVSRYNTSTRKLTAEMFRQVVRDVAEQIDPTA